jgi:molybdate transport system substrate-binding protein
MRAAYAAIASVPLVLAACSGAATARPELTVYAAASTRDAIREIGALFQNAHNATVIYNFGSSGDLSRQIVAAAKADVFLSADESEMDRIASAGLLDSGSRVTLLGNELVVIEPAATASIFSQPFSARQLATDAVRILSLANVETVPAGKYAKAWLETQDVWQQVSIRTLQAVDVRAALAAVQSGAAQAGIVYSTDAAITNDVRVVHRVPAPEHPPITYPIGAIASSKQRALAHTFINFTRSDTASSIFVRHGFAVIK